MNFLKLLLFICVLSITAQARAEVVPGTIDGQLSVSMNGSATYTVPFAVPSGVAGMSPKLFLSYDSNSGPSPFGLGWSLTGVSSITRINRTALIDGQPAPITFDDITDAVALDGERLVEAPEGGRYLSKSVDDQTRVWRNGQSYIAKTKAGLTLYFGESTNSRILTTSGNVARWALSRVVDTFGNQIVFLYTQKDGDFGVEKAFWTVPSGSLGSADLYNEVALKSVSHSRLEIDYTDGGAAYSSGFVGGEEAKRSLTANSLVSYVGDAEYRRYEFFHRKTGRLGGQILTAIREVGADIGGPRVEYPKTEFSYTEFVPQWNSVTDYQLPSGLGTEHSLKSGFRLVDLDGDGDRDLLYSAFVGGHSIRRAFRQDQSGWVSTGSLRPPIDFSFGSDEADAVFFFDSDSDGLPEIYSSRSVEGIVSATAHFQEGGAWKESGEQSKPPFAVVGDGARLHRVFGTKWNAESKLLVWDELGELAAWNVEEEAWKSMPVSVTTNTGMPAQVLEADFDCDGSDDLALLAQDSKSIHFFRKLASSDGDFQLEETAKYTLDKPALKIRELVKSDCASVLILEQDTNQTSVLSFDESGDGEIDVFILPVPNNQLSRVSDVFGVELEGGNDQEVAVFLDGEVGQPNLIAFGFDPIIDTWSPRPTFAFAPSVASEIIDDAYLIFPEDIDDDSRQDFLLLPATGGVATKALRNNGNSFDLVFDFVPPIEFSRQEKVGAAPQFVDLNADGLTDVVGHYVDKDGKEIINTAQINTMRGWTSVESLKLPKPITHEKGGRAGAFIDFNSDGVADFVYAYGDTSNWGAWTVEFDSSGNALGWKQVSAFVLPADARLSDPNHGDLGVRFMDLNADGRVDILVSRRETSGSLFEKAYLNNGNGWDNAPAQFLPPVPFVSRNAAEVHYETKASQGDYYRDLRVSVLDFNGDGLADLAFRYGHKAQTAGFGLVYQPGKSWCQNKDRIEPGDGVFDPPKVIKHNIPTESQCAGIFLSTGNGWAVGADGFLPPVKLDLSIEEENASLDITDINGDGLPDLIPARLVGTDNSYPAFLNTGTGWHVEEAFALPVAALSADKNQVSHRLLDINGDGLIDVVFNSPDLKKGSFLNNGVGWMAANEEYAPPEAFVNEKGEDLGVRFLDVDGNGLPDALRSYRNKDGILTQSAHLNSGDQEWPLQAIESRADMLKSVSNGMGLTTTFAYRSLLSPRALPTSSEDDFYIPSPISEYPVVSHVPTMFAVQEMSFVDTDGSAILTRYQYKGFRFDVPAAAALGFEERTARSFVNGAESNISERITLFQEYMLAGSIKHEIAVVDDVFVSETMNTYSVLEAAPGSWPKRLVLADTLTKSRDLNGDLTGATHKFFLYDEHNNVAKSCTEFGDGSRTLTENTFDVSPDIISPAVHFLGRLQKAVVSHYRTSVARSCDELLEGLSDVPSSAIITNSAEFKYDIRRNDDGQLQKNSTGVLVEEISNSDHPLAITKSYHFDDFGNVIREDFDSSGEPTRSKFMEYDSIGRYVVVDRNALGHETTYKFSELLGLPIEVTDANLVKNQSEYDGFGRLTTAISHNGVTATEERRFVQDIDVLGRPASFVQIRKFGELPEATTYYDFQGRVLRTESVGKSEGSQRSIYQDTSYDSRGRSIATSMPYFEGNEQYYSQTKYDNLDRPVRVIAPDGGVSTTIYSGLVVSLIDASGKSSSTRFSLKGLKLETIDNSGGVLSYVYGPGDRLLKTVQVDGSELVYEYDQIGNRIASADPDLGLWEYKFNGFLELVWQRDAKGQITTISYDSLGRPTRRHMPDKVDEFQYDQSEFGVGKPSSITSSDGYAENFTYDSKGRLYRKFTHANDEVFSTSVSYDDYDRPVQIYYPGNYIVYNEYDELGFLKTVQANDPLGPFLAQPDTHWTAVERDEYGRVIEEVLGNGVSSTYEFDPLKGSLSRVSAQAEDNNRITDISLEYDLVGNLVSKVLETSNQQQSYEYDSLDRITSWQVNGAVRASYAYDAAGRILSKSDFGVYSYSGDGPVHAVKQVTSPDGTLSKYQYDANGNLVFGPKGHFEYYSNNSVKLIYKSNDTWSRFAYAPDGSRYFQQYSESRTTEGDQSLINVRQVFSIGLYENIRDLGGAFLVKPGGFQRHRLYLAAEGGVVAVLEHSTEFDPLYELPLFKAGQEGSFLATAQVTKNASYLHKDELGSVLKVTNENSDVVSGYEYDPWGKKTQVSWLAKGKEDFAEGTFRRGYTGHEHLDNLNLVHMNGRVYDPDLARFVSADPTLQFPNYTQNYDRYSYVLNNPLAFTDPSGFGLGSFLKKIGNAIAKPFQEIGRFVEKNWREIVIVVVTVAAVIVTGPGGALAMNAILSGMVVGAVSAGVSTALYGGSFSDVLGAMVLGAAVGGLTAGVADAIGTYGLENGWAEGGVRKVAAHGTVGGLRAEMTGGDFKSGFLSAAITQAFAPRIGNIRGFEGAQAARIASAAALGGTASALGGGKFANGAVTGAFMRAYNDELHFDGKKLVWKDDHGKVLEEFEGVSGIDGHQDANSQELANKGPIPEGSYDVKQSRYQQMGDRSYFEMLKAELGGTAWPGGESSWGRERIWVSPRAGTNTYGRSGFSIHGGSSPGSRGCIDLCGNNSRFMNRFRSYGKDMELTVDY
ncbi:MAG: SpvB/TcaC N-terminal domain-containing protein [Paracoccaceae bacterium]